MKFLLSLILTVVIAGSSIARDTFSGKVMEVREGDFLVVSVGDGVMMNVRLEEIDCPEKGQNYFEEARKLSEKLALGKEVTVSVSEKTGSDTVIGTVILNKKGTNLGFELVAAGLAWHLQKGLTYTENTEALLDLMDEAQVRSKGLWEEGNPVAPWAYRQRQNMYEAKSSMD
jgi:endonuclease YncB( thermonuclease family)